MDIYDFAMQMEKDGENYYRDLAGKTNNKGVENILNMLADEEVKHFKLLNKMKSQNPDHAKTEILANVKNVFQSLKDSKKSYSPDISQSDLYRKAQELEKKSETFYKEKSSEVNEDKKKNLLLQLADEEKRHYNILESLIDFVNKPDRYLADAEFSNIDDY